MSKTDLLIVVHPGSLCGSLWWSAAKPQATTDAIIAEIDGWTGPKVAVYGELEDELDDRAYRDLANSVNAISDIVDGDPSKDGLTDAARDILRLHPSETLNRVVVTGAWADPDSGCVNMVADALRILAPGLTVEISPNAAVEG